ncbi:hypothetical protein E2320_001780, partial [Naja naja]
QLAQEHTLAAASSVYSFLQKIKTLLSAAVSVSISTPRRQLPSGKIEPSRAFSTKLFQQLATSEGTPSQPSHGRGGDRIPAARTFFVRENIHGPCRGKQVVKESPSISSALKMTIPSYTVNGIEGQPLRLEVAYNFNFTISDIQIIWLFEKPPTNPKYLLISVNRSVVPDLEYRHKFTLLPPNASLLINSLHRSDEGNYIVKINIRGNGTKSVSEKIKVTVDEGTRVVYQWMKNENPIEDSSNGSMIINKDTLSIAPVLKEAIGNYSCLVTNPISAMMSDMFMPTIYLIQQKLNRKAPRTKARYRRGQTMSGHENAGEDFGAYEFIDCPVSAGIP